MGGAIFLSCSGEATPQRCELPAHLIRAVSVAPGMLETPLLIGLYENPRTVLAQQVPYPARFARPAEFARLVAHIVENEMPNGDAIRLDDAIGMAPR